MANSHEKQLDEAKKIMDEDKKILETLTEPDLTKTTEVLTKEQSKAVRDAKSQLQLQIADIINRKKQIDNDLNKLNALVQSLDKMFK